MNKRMVLGTALAICAGTFSTAASAATVVVTNSGTNPNTLPLVLVPLGGGSFSGGSTDTLTSAGTSTRNYSLRYTFAAPTDGEGSISFTATSAAAATALLTVTSAFFNGTPVSNLAMGTGPNGSRTYTGSFDFANALAGDPFTLVLNGTVRRGGTLSTSLSFATSAVPEPAAWAMMIGGFGLVGSAMRRRRSAVRTSVSFA